MRNTRWLRYGFASTIAIAAGAALTIAACGDDDVDPGPVKPGTPETSTPETSIPDANNPDTAPKVDAGTNAKLTIVNAATDMGLNSQFNRRGDAAVRICFRQGTTMANLAIAGFPPLPEKASASSPAGTPPGIFYGTGGTFPSFGLDLSTRLVQPIVMNAKALLLKGIVGSGIGKACDELIGPLADAAVGLMPNIDYWELPVIDIGAFQKEKSYVLVLTGCVANHTTASPPKCGANAPAGGAGATPGVGNLSVKILETTRTPVSATDLGAQFLYASTQAGAVFGSVAFPIAPGFMSNPADAGTFKAASPGPVTALTISAATAVPGVVETDFFVSSVTNPTATGPTGPFPLTTIQKLSALPAPSIFVNGKNFVFINVGDPDRAIQPTFLDSDGGPGDAGDPTNFNLRSYHYLAFETDPTVLPYMP